MPDLTATFKGITVGVHADDGAQGHTEGQSVADIASIHEFGAPQANVPQRSFVRAWFDEASASGELMTTLKAELASVVEGKRTLKQALERSALRFEGSVKERIRRHIPPPLKPATIKRKGSSTPLIDRGVLRNSVRGRVV
jgi:hypothetical protein